MADSWEDGWDDPLPGLPSWNRPPPTPEPQAQININSTADDSLISRAIALNERKRREPSNDTVIPILLPVGMQCPQQIRFRLDDYHRRQNIIPLSEVREPYPLQPIRSTLPPERNVVSPIGQINGIRITHMSRVENQLNRQLNELNVSHSMTTSPPDN